MSDCLVWPGIRNRDDYGIVEREHRHSGEMYAHRAMWKVAHGTIPDGAWVLHHCDNRACVNPEHLYLGDNAANVRDRQERGRQAKGLRHGKAKLSDAAVDIIKAQVAQGMAQKDVARLHGVSRSLVSCIVNGKRRAA